MGIGQGFNGITGVVKEAAWGTAIAVTEALPFVKEDWSKNLEEIPDEALRGEAGANAPAYKNKIFRASLPFQLTYEDLDLLIAIALGAAGTPSVNGALYDNTYSLAEAMTYSFICAILKNVDVWEYCGCKVNTLKISGQANKALAAEFGVCAKDLDRASATNTPAVLNALDTEDDAPRIFFSDMEFKIAAQGDALTGETAKGISQFELMLDNKLKMDDFDNRSLTILEPVRDGKRDVRLNLWVPRYESDEYQDWFDDSTPLHAYLKFTSGNYVFDIHLPKLIITNADAPLEGPGLIGQKLECRCSRDPDSDSATFTLTDELEIDVTNGRSASPLA